MSDSNPYSRERMRANPYSDLNLAERMCLVSSLNTFVRMGIGVTEDNLRFVTRDAARKAAHAALDVADPNDGVARVLRRLVEQLDEGQPFLRDHKVELEQLRPGLIKALADNGWVQQPLASCWSDNVAEFRALQIPGDGVQLLVPLEDIEADPAGDGLSNMLGRVRAGCVALFVSEEISEPVGMAISVLVIDRELPIERTVERVYAVARTYQSVPLGRA